MRPRRMVRAAEARHRRPAQCGQIDADQPDAGEGTVDHRARGRDHPRFHRHRLGMARPQQWRPPGPPDRHGRDAQEGEGRGQAREALRRRRPPGGRFRRGGRASARRDEGAGGAGFEDRRQRPSGGPSAGDRGQQMGRGGNMPPACSTASRRRWRRACRKRAESLCSPSRARPARARRPPQGRVRDRDIWFERVSTGQLNRWFEDAVEKNPPPAPGGKRIKLRVHHPGEHPPPSFVIFGTRVDQLPDTYLRYLVNGIRKELGFGAVPVRLAARASRNPYKKTD